MQEMHGFVYHYETLGNNEHWYYHPAGYKVECEKQFFDTPGPCKAIDEYGKTRATKTDMGNWKNVTVRPGGFGHISNATTTKCVEDNLVWVDNPNNPGEIIMDITLIEKCFNP